MAEEKEYVMTARTTFTIEMDHPSAWDPKSCAEQVFNAGDRENTNSLESMILEYRKTNSGRAIRIISHDTAVVVYKRKV